MVPRDLGVSGMPFPFRTWALIALLTLAVACPASAQQQRRPPAATPQRPAPPAPPAATPQLPVPQETPGVQGKLADPMAVPSFWDPRRRPERPDLTRITIIRFLTETDYPPFNFTGADGTPAGFNVDLARMICEEMKVPCTVQQRRFDTLIPSQQERGRRHHRLACRDHRHAPSARLQRALLPHAGALRVAPRRRDRRRAAAGARRQ